MTRENNELKNKMSRPRRRPCTHSQTGGNTGHDERDQVVQVGIRRAGDLQGVHANVVERLVVDTVGLVRVLDQLVDGQGGVVRLDDGVRDLRESDWAT